MAALPNDATGEALNEFIKNGSDLTKPMEIDFFVAVPSEKTGDEVAIRVKPLGFRVSVEQDTKSGDWTCYCTKTLIPEYTEVIKIEKLLTNIAEPFGGYSDGFGSYGNTKQ